MKRITFPIVLGFSLAGCASMQEGGSYVGRPIAEVVQELGPPDSIADYQSGGRYFSWTISDVRVQFDDAANPANWLEPMTRMNAPDKLDDDKLVSLPDVLSSLMSRRTRPFLRT